MDSKIINKIIIIIIIICIIKTHNNKIIRIKKITIRIKLNNIIQTKISKDSIMIANNTNIIIDSLILL